MGGSLLDVPPRVTPGEKGTGWLDLQTQSCCLAAVEESPSAHARPHETSARECQHRRPTYVKVNQPSLHQRRTQTLPETCAPRRTPQATDHAMPDLAHDEATNSGSGGDSNRCRTMCPVLHDVRRRKNSSPGKCTTRERPACLRSRHRNETPLLPTLGIPSLHPQALSDAHTLRLSAHSESSTNSLDLKSFAQNSHRSPRNGPCSRTSKSLTIGRYQFRPLRASIWKAR